MDILTPGDIVSIVPEGRYERAPYHKMIRMEILDIGSKKHTLEGPWIYLGKTKKFHPGAAGVKKAKIQWVGSKFVACVREDWLKLVIEDNASVAELVDALP